MTEHRQRETKSIYTSPQGHQGENKAQMKIMRQHKGKGRDASGDKTIKIKPEHTQKKQPIILSN